MPSHLVVKIGSDRFNEQPAIINRSDRPFEIDSEHFVGRVLVRVRDAPGAKEGQDGMEYFKDRSRKFCIQIEGRFKKQWKGSQILFGTDFDHLVDIPRAPFNTGMRIARFIDPCTFYEETPPSGRPYIMSPYVACMNTICAWPAPSRAQDAVVVLRQVKDGGKSPGITRSTTPILNENKGKSKENSLTSSPINSEDEGDVVPVESLHRTSSVKKEDGTNSNGNGPNTTTTTEKKKKRSSWFGGFGGPVKEKDERKPKKYWRFVGFKDEPAVRAILEAHHADTRIERSSSIARSRRQGSGSESGSIPSTSNSPSPMNDQNPRNLSPSDVQHGPTPPTLSRLGTSNLGEVLAPPERSNTPRPPDGFDSSSRASSPSPISPIVGQLTSPITNTFTGIAQSIASPIANIVRSPSPLAKEVVNEESSSSSSSSSTTTNQKNGSITSHHPKSPSTTIPPHPLEQNKNGSSSNSTSPQIKATPAPRLVAPKAQMAQVQPDSELEPEFPPLERISSDVRHKAQEAAKSDGLEEKDFKLADELMNHLYLNHSSSNDKEWKSKLDEQLGPYRFSDPSTDMMEDNAFIFKWDSVPVPKRRKHFADAQVREDFIYDPDIVYGTSFFTDAADLNTLSLSLGPVKMGLQRFFTDMPIRYSLRATGPEELTFCTVSFQLVED